MNQIQSKDDSKEFKRKLREQEIFDIEKNGDIKTSIELKTKYKDEDINYTRLYTRIVNYRINHYGSSYYEGNSLPNKIECIRRKMNSQHRHSYRRRKYGLRKATMFDSI